MIKNRVQTQHPVSKLWLKIDEKTGHTMLCRRKPYKNIKRVDFYFKSSTSDEPHTEHLQSLPNAQLIQNITHIPQVKIESIKCNK